MRFCTLALFLLPVAALAAQDGAKKLEVTAEPENVVASRLLGRWSVDTDLGKRLGGKPHWNSLEFVADAKVLEGIKPEQAQKLGKFTIRLAGTMNADGTSHPFLLLELHGNPHVVYFRERKGDPMGDTESFNVALVRAATPEQDLLFAGGDRNNQPFAAYARAAAKDEKAMGPAAALADMVQLMEAKKYVQMIQRYAQPDELDRAVKGAGSIEKLAADFAERRAEEILGQLREALKTQPELSEDGKIAQWPVEVHSRKLQLQKIDGRWYIKDR